MKKLCVFVVLIFLLASGCTPAEHESPSPPDITKAVNFTNLQLDQGEAFISISSNVIGGYNRWIPFYFSVQTESKYTNEEIVQSLEENIKTITLFSENNETLVTSSDLIWTSADIGDNKYNLVLVIIPELENTAFNNMTLVISLSLSNDSESKEYTLPKCLIEAKETALEKDFFVSLSTFDTRYSEGDSCQINYGILDKNDNKINEFALVYPSSFGVEKYEFIHQGIEDKDYTFKVNAHFSSRREKLMFRPFIKIKYSDANQEAYLIPALPAYINSPDSKSELYF